MGGEPRVRGGEGAREDAKDVAKDSKRHAEVGRALMFEEREQVGIAFRLTDFHEQLETEGWRKVGFLTVTDSASMSSESCVDG